MFLLWIIKKLSSYKRTKQLLKIFLKILRDITNFGRPKWAEYPAILHSKVSQHDTVIGNVPYLLFHIHKYLKLEKKIGFCTLQNFFLDLRLVVLIL